MPKNVGQQLKAILPQPTFCTTWVISPIPSCSRVAKWILPHSSLQLLLRCPSNWELQLPCWRLHSQFHCLIVFLPFTLARIRYAIIHFTILIGLCPMSPHIVAAALREREYVLRAAPSTVRQGPWTRNSLGLTMPLPLNGQLPHLFESNVKPNLQSLISKPTELTNYLLIKPFCPITLHYILT